MNNQLKYSILLLANNTYFKLLHICVKSIYASCIMERICKIYIADLGLQREHLEILINLGEKIEIINTDKNIGDSKKLFTKEWVDAVSQKTTILHMIVKNKCIPIIMLDSDTIVMEDFSDVIDLNYDIQVCKRCVPMLRKDGLSLDFIASFFVANSVKAELFIEDWIYRISQRVNSKLMPPYETPAMIEAINSNTGLNIGFLDEDVISCENNYIKGTTKIIHAKSRNTNDKISVYRFANIKKLPFSKVVGLFDNSMEKALFTLMFLQKRIFPIHDLKKFIKKVLRKK